MIAVQPNGGVRESTKHAPGEVNGIDNLARQMSSLGCAQSEPLGEAQAISNLAEMPGQSGGSAESVGIVQPKMAQQKVSGGVQVIPTLAQMTQRMSDSSGQSDANSPAAASKQEMAQQMGTSDSGRSRPSGEVQVIPRLAEVAGGINPTASKAENAPHMACGESNQSDSNGLSGRIEHTAILAEMLSGINLTTSRTENAPRTCGEQSDQSCNGPSGRVEPTRILAEVTGGTRSNGENPPHMALQSDQSGGNGQAGPSGLVPPTASSTEVETHVDVAPGSGQSSESGEPGEITSRTAPVRHGISSGHPKLHRSSKTGR